MTQAFRNPVELAIEALAGRAVHAMIPKTNHATSSSPRNGFHHLPGIS